MVRHHWIGLFVCLTLVSCHQEKSNQLQKEAGITNTNLILQNTDDYKQNYNLSSLGTQKILVIPCQFKDEPSFTSEMLEKIERAFFEENLSSNENCYYSLKEYYAKTSLNQLEITGEVTEVVQIPYTVEEIEQTLNYLPGIPAQFFMNEASDTLLQEYDANQDGFVDSVCFIYSTPMSDTSNFWAWVSTFDTQPNVNRPELKRHMWCGYDSFEKETYVIDTHTIIHETGHLLGLRDYYPSDNLNVALGGHSMMDYNISDHDPYSKMLLSWCDPIYYDFLKNPTITIQLKPFQGTNEVLLLNVSWNHSVMDEYLLVEYYTPDELNELDAKTKYENRPIGFSKPGIKIYHVDSRVAHCTFNALTNQVDFISYVDEIPQEKSSELDYYVIGASNNLADSYTDASRQGRYKQIQLIENKEYNFLQSGQTADDDSLFYEGDVFNSNQSAFLTNGLFNNQEKIGFQITIDQLSKEYATLTISYDGGE